MTTLAEMLMGKVLPPDGEVVDRGAFLPLGTYRRPDGTETTSLAFPQAARDGLDALAYALGYRQDPQAPAGYVTQDALNRGGQGLAESAMVGSLAARAPAGALRSGVTRNQISREGPTLTVHRDGVGGVMGYVENNDPRIWFSELDDAYRGQGLGSQMYREWAQEAGGPFRSDGEVSREASAMYEHMFPKYGYNVLRNPEAVFDPQGGANKTGGWSVPPGGDQPRHVYRVEPPSMNSTEFYANARPGSGVGAAMSAARQQDDMMRRMMELNDAADAEMARRRAEGPKDLTPEQQAQLDEIERLKQAFAKRAPRVEANPLAGAVPLMFDDPDQRRQMIARHLMQGGA